MKTIPLSAARTLHLMAQGLLAPPRRKATKADVLDAIRRMAQLQIDTIHVVARSPYLVLFSRLGDYQPPWRLSAALATISRNGSTSIWPRDPCSNTGRTRPAWYP
jgi:uncharacterized protein YcaQ